MNSELNRRLKILLITASLLISSFVIYVWLIGPVQAYEYEQTVFLNKIYRNTAFDSCELVNNTQIDADVKLAQCQVNESHMVWLSLDVDAHVIDRHNFYLDIYLDNMNTLKQRYQTDEVSFSYYKGEFVYNIKTEDEEFFLDLNNFTKVFRVSK